MGTAGHPLTCNVYCGKVVPSASLGSSSDANTTFVYWAKTRFNSEGTIHDTINEKYGSTYVLPPDPVRPGYMLSGWFTEESGGTRVTDSTILTLPVPYTAGLTDLYARWDPSATLTFAAQPSGAGAVSHTTLPVAKGTAIALNPDRSLTIGTNTVTATPLAGQVFAGWDSVPAKADADCTVTALFRAASDPADSFVTLTFAAQPGGAGSVSHTSVTVAKGTPVTLNPDKSLAVGTFTVRAVAASGYVFAGWDSVPAKADADCTVTALFRATGDPADSFVTLTFAADPAAGSVSHTSVTAAKGTPVTLNGDKSLTIGTNTVTATPLAGQVFAGWDSVPARADADCTVTANFVRVTPVRVTVTFAEVEGAVYVVNGIVTKPGEYVFEDRTFAAITLTALDGYSVGKAVVDCQGRSGNPLYVLFDEDMVVSAHGVERLPAPIPPGPGPGPGPNGSGGGSFLEKHWAAAAAVLFTLVLLLLFLLILLWRRKEDEEEA